jgi:hypothetical protein
MDYKKEIIVRGIKIIDIGFITAIYMSLGIILAKMCDIHFGKFDENVEKKKPLWKSIVEIMLYLWFVGVVIYIVRNIVPLIPFPLNGIYGFDHLKVKEVTSAGVFSIAFVYFQEYYQEKLKYIYSRIA